LFKYRSNTLCETHDLLDCKCCITKVEKEDGEEVRGVSPSFTIGFHVRGQRYACRKHSSKRTNAWYVLAQDDGFIDDDDADQIEPGYIVRRVKKKDFSGEELEGWDHYPSVEYVQVLLLLRPPTADTLSGGFPL
jgi:hypothetical protein